MCSYIFKKRVYDETHVVVQGESPLHLEDGETLIFRPASDEAYEVGNVIALTNNQVPGVHVRIVAPACEGDVVWEGGTVALPVDSKSTVIGYLVDRRSPAGQKKHVPRPCKSRYWEDRDQAIAEAILTLKVG